MRNYIILIVTMTSISMAGLVKPVNGSTLNYIHVLFEWEQESGASSYNLQVFQDNNLIIDIMVSSLNFIADENIVWETSLSWKVRPNNSENWIGPYTFFIGSTISNVEVIIHNENLYSTGLTIFSSFFSNYSAIIDQEGNEIFKSKSVNKFLIPFYKMLKFHRTKVQCSECKRQFTFFHKWFNKKMPKCPYCLE